MTNNRFPTTKHDLVGIRFFKTVLLTSLFILFSFSFLFGETSEYKVDHFSLNFQPVYPLLTDKETSVRVMTDLDAYDIWIYLTHGKRIRMKKDGNKWVGVFIPEDSPPYGFRPLFVYIKHREKILSDSIYKKFIAFLGGGDSFEIRRSIFVGKMWYKVFKPHPKISDVLQSENKGSDDLTVVDILDVFNNDGEKQKEEIVKGFEGEKEIKNRQNLSEGFEENSFSSEGEVFLSSYPTKEPNTLIIKGNRVFAFSSKSVEGSKEGFLPGVNREESLRLNISGKIKEAEIDASLFSSSILGVDQVSSKEEIVSVLLKTGSTEVYFGDYKPFINDLEFSRLDKVLSGFRVTGDYGKWNLKMFFATPKGISRIEKVYGDGTQGPYLLNSSPVVIDSERVYVDALLQRRGNDYEIDYLAGTITFKNRVIPKQSVLKIYYDLRETIYSHLTYALYTKVNPIPSLKIGASYINDSDSLDNAATISQSTSIEPQSHLIFGLNGAFGYQDLINLQSEVAYSVKKNKLLSDPSLKEDGRAAKLDVISSFGPFNFSGKLKKIGLGFEPIGQADPKQDLSEYNTLLGFRVNPNLFLEGSLYDSYYLENSVRYKTINKDGRMNLAYPAFPSFLYSIKEIWESNDPVTSDRIDRLTKRNSVEIKHLFQIVNLSVNGGREERFVTTPSLETTVYNTVGTSFSLIPQDKFSASGNIELKDTFVSSGDNSYTKEYILNLSAFPAPEYVITGSLDHIDDTKDGVFQVADLSYKANLLNYLKTDGKCTVSSLKETFGATKEGIRKEEASIRFEVSPIDNMRVRYYYKPNITLLNRTLGLTYSNTIKQFEANLAMFSSTVFSYSLQNFDRFTIDKNDFPFYLRKQNMENGGTKIYSVKTAPLQFLSCEFNYIDDGRTTYTLISSEGTFDYSRDNFINNEFMAVVKSSLTNKIAIDSSYSVKTSTSGSKEAFDNTQNLLTQSIGLKGIFYVNNELSFNISSSYSRIVNYLSDNDENTYTFEPGLGFVYSLPGKLRLDGEYLYAKSYSGANMENSKVNLRGIYDFSGFLHFALRIETEINSFPYYKTSDFSGNVEINL